MAILEVRSMATVSRSQEILSSSPFLFLLFTGHLNHSPSTQESNQAGPLPFTEKETEKFGHVGLHSEVYSNFFITKTMVNLN